MSDFVLNAEKREILKRQAKRARRDGLVPGVYYTHGEPSITIAVPQIALMPLVRTSETHIIDLHVGDNVVKKCILKDVQYDPVTDLPVHFDLQGLRENEKLTVEVPVVLTGGTPAGVRDGGMLQHIIHKLRVSCLPKDIPQKVEIDVSALGINDSVHVSSISLPNVTILENAESAIVGVMPPALVKEAEVAPTEEEAPKEPEVVGKGKKAEEGEEGAAEAPKAESKEKK